MEMNLAPFVIGTPLEKTLLNPLLARAKFLTPELATDFIRKRNAIIATIVNGTLKHEFGLLEIETLLII